MGKHARTCNEVSIDEIEAAEMARSELLARGEAALRAKQLEPASNTMNTDSTKDIKTQINDHLEAIAQLSAIARKEETPTYKRWSAYLRACERKIADRGTSPADLAALAHAMDTAEMKLRGVTRYIEDVPTAK